MIHGLFWPEIPEGFLTEDFSTFNFNSIPLTRFAMCWQLPKLQSLYVHSPADQISQDGMKSGIRKKEHWKMIKAEWDKLVHEWNWIGKVLTCKALCCNKLYAWFSISTAQNCSPNSSKWSWANDFFKSYTFKWYLPFIHVSNQRPHLEFLFNICWS